MARLLVTQGNRSGQAIPLGDQPLVIGRSSTADVTLDGGNVSRKHARIFREGKQIYIEDLGSSNGTIVNDRSIDGRQPLVPGDVIRIGSHWLRLESDAALEEDFTIQRQTAAMASNADLYRENASEKLRVVLELSHHLGLSLDADELFTRVARHLMVLFPHADRAIVILNENGAPNVRVAQDRTSGKSGAGAAFSRTVVRKVFEQGMAVLAEDTKGLDTNLTLNAMGVRSLICVPLQTHSGRNLGALQLDRFQAGRPFSSEDLHLLTAIALQVSMVIENANLHQELIAKERIERDLALAREIQRGFLPGELPEFSGGKIEFAGELESAQEVSGDFYDAIPIDERYLAVVVADVSGKGMPAALFMTMVRSLLRELVQRHRSPAEILARLNHSIARENPKFIFVTVLLAIYDVQTGRCVLARAGHPPAILRSGVGEAPTLVAPCGPLLGIESPCPPLVEAEIEMSPGDVLVLYTDGLTEAANLRTEEMFGLDRLVGAVAASPQSEPLTEWIKRIRGKVDEFLCGSNIQDDVTLVLLRRPCVPV